MKIPNSVNPLTRAFPSSSTASTGSQQTSTTGSSAIPDHAPVISAAGCIASGLATDDVRMNKVEGIKTAFQSGSYNIEPSAVATKLVDSMLGQAF